eukprot:6874719-Pyramimonas_sp.AAC.1
MADGSPWRYYLSLLALIRSSMIGICLKASVGFFPGTASAIFTQRSFSEGILAFGNAFTALTRACS